MVKGGTGRRFARAIFELASQKGDYDQWLQDLRDVRDFLADQRVAAMIQNPEVPFDRKKSIIDAGLSALDELRRNFVYVLVERRHSDLIDKIIVDFERLLNERRGVAIAEVVTAVPLDAETSKYVAERLSALTGKKVTVKASVDPGIIGGVVAKIGDQLINGSVADRLVRMRQRLAEA